MKLVVNSASVHLCESTKLSMYTDINSLIWFSTLATKKKAIIVERETKYFKASIVIDVDKNTNKKIVFILFRILISRPTFLYFLKEAKRLISSR